MAFAITTVVFIWNWADVDPAGMVTDPGAVVLTLFEASDTTTPAVGAEPFSPTVPTAETPPTTEFGLMVNVASPAGRRVSVAVLAALLRLAVMDSFAWVVTPRVVAVKVALVAPSGTVIDDCAETLGPLVFSVTVMPPVGAAALIETVPVVELPPTTELGDNERPESSLGASTVRIAD